MSYQSRLKKACKEALRLPLTFQTKYVLFSDCHRGVGNSNDNFLKNQTLFLAALQHYMKTGFSYVEMGDGDELWENREPEQITTAHRDIFELFSCLQQQNRLYMLYGNHDIIKRKSPDFHPGILLEAGSFSPHTRTPKPLFLVHGHQADFLNSTLWPLARFLVRYFWKPLEHFGLLDMSSPAKNNSKKHRIEKKLHHFALSNNLTLIAGHTHRPLLSGDDLSYCNCGSCVHPYSITCIEIERYSISLIKWSLSVRADRSLVVNRSLLSGPFPL